MSDDVMRRFAAALPRLGEIVTPLAIGRWPTPIEDISGSLGVPRLFVKRDDQSAEHYGGSKVRNLEWILADARRRGATTLFTVATWGSHLALALAVHGRRAGFRVRCVLIPQPPSAEVEATFAATLSAGAEVRRCGTMIGVPAAVLREWFALRRSGERPYLVGPGGASPIGSLGYVRAAFEIAADVAAGRLPLPDYVHCAAGSCGTLVGLSEGFALLGAETTVVGVRVVPRIATMAPRLAWMHARLRRLLARAGSSVGRPASQLLVHDHAGRGYGHPLASAAATVNELSKRSIALDDTYTAKSLTALASFVHRRNLGDRTHLFIDTYAPPPPSSFGTANLSSRS